MYTTAMLRIDSKVIITGYLNIMQTQIISTYLKYFGEVHIVCNYRHNYDCQPSA